MTPAGASTREEEEGRGVEVQDAAGCRTLFCLLQKLEVADQPKKRRRKDYLMVKMIEYCLGKLIVFPSFATFSPL